MSRNLTLVTGATGKTGRRVALELQARGVEVRSVSRGSKIPFDWNDASTWGNTLRGVSSIYIVHPGLGTDEAAEQIERFAVEAASAGSVKAVLASTPDDGSAFSESVRASERAIEGSGLSLTSLRLRWFFQNFSEDFLLDSVLSGELRMPAGSGREAFVDADDIAAVAVAALTDDQHNGNKYEITGPRLLGFSDVAGEISRLAGVNLKYVPLQVDEFLAEQIELGSPPEWAYMLASIYQDIATGKLESISPDVARILGRPAGDFSSYVAKMAEEKTWSR